MTDELDPVYVSSRREACIALAALGLFVVFTVTWSASAAYELEAPEVPTTLGVPDWVWVGVVAPWLAAILFAAWFAFVAIEDAPLGPDEESSE